MDGLWRHQSYNKRVSKGDNCVYVLLKLVRTDFRKKGVKDSERAAGCVCRSGPWVWRLFCWHVLPCVQNLRLFQPPQTLPKRKGSISSLSVYLYWPGEGTDFTLHTHTHWNSYLLRPQIWSILPLVSWELYKCCLMQACCNITRLYIRCGPGRE